MRFSAVAVIGVSLPLAVHGANILMGNDDGWAEMNIRTFYNTLRAAGENAIVSAPAENQSGTGSRTGPVTTLSMPCEYDSCPAGSPGFGFNASEPRLNYVNSYPAPAIHHGIINVSPKFFKGGRPDIVVTGFNVGVNTGLADHFSGTVGAACEAVTFGIPAIAFSASTGQQTGWDNPTPLYAKVYADLATNLTQTIIASGKPYLPTGSFLNVNFSPVSESQCNDPYKFKYILTRLHGFNLMDRKDVLTCGSHHLPTEHQVMKLPGCYVSISVGVAKTKDDDYDSQPAVLAKLQDILSCAP